MLLQLVEEMLTLVGGLCIAYFIYMFLARRNNDKPTTESPAMAHSALREIIEQVIEEAKGLPGFGDSISARTETAQDGRNIIEHSYEELLATAILNKVVEQFQRNQLDGNRSIINNKTVLSIKPSLSIDGSEQKYRSTVGSMGHSYNRAFAAQEEKHSEPLTLTLEERIEEITTYMSEENHQDNNALPISNSHRVPFPELGMDIIDPFQESSDSQEESDTTTTHIDMVSPVASWEENWLFQKKKISTQANPVAMLVPNSTAEFKALIGDRDAEDTSDLSECSSMHSDEQIDKELFEVISNVQPQPLEKKNASVKNNCNVSNMDNVKEAKVGCIESSNAKIVNRRNSKTDMRDVCKTDEKTQAEKLMENDRVCLEIAKNNVGDDGRSLQYVTFTRETIEEEGKDILGKKSNQKDMVTSNEKNKNVENVVQIEYIKKEISNQTENTELIKAICDNTVRDFSDEKEKVAKEQVLNNNTLHVSVVKEEGNILDVPRTPVCTPTFTLRTQDFPCANNAEFFTSNSLTLNSLESAKQKLINVDENKMNTNEEDEANLHADKVTDFHESTEDVQQEREYTEHYDIATQRHLDSLTKDHSIDNENEKSKTSILCDISNKHKESDCKEPSDKEFSDNSSILSKTFVETVQFATPPRPGSIAEREHKKWANAPPIENNPYSEENIQRRLWERQYSRVSSDIQGMHADSPKSTDANLEDVLSPHAPDIKRFGRDYYINHSKMECNDKGQKSTISNSSRPSSSLSQKSSSTGANQDPKFQEGPQNKGATVVLNSHNNVKSKVAQWQKNNIESSYQTITRDASNLNSTVKIPEIKEIEETCLKEIGMPVCCQKSLEKQQVEDMENQRKNSKNEINAKLNNHENNYDSGVILETKNSDENRKKIQRIDLKAFGFENEISPDVSKSGKTSSQRVVNRLNLASFGYDDGLRRVQSNNHLDSTIKECEFKSELIGIANKLNLSIHKKLEYYDDRMKSGILRNDNLTKSSEALNKTYGATREIHSLKAAKSVPNITNYESYLHSTDKRDRTMERYNAQNLFGGINQLDTVKFTEKNDDSHDNNSENDTNYSPEKEDSQSKDALMTHTNKQKTPYVGYKKLPLPSVKLLAQAFNKQPDSPTVPIPRAVKSDRICQERSATPEVHIVETPKQMHSLTARSLSKKFREGLRQIPNKMTSPPASHVTMEQRYKIPNNESEHAQIQPSDSQDDIDAILPGKLKSNIIFWEQLQKRK